MLGLLGGGALNGMMDEDPRRQGLLSAALAGLAASGPSTKPVSFGQTLGQAGMQGMQSMRDAEQFGMARDMKNLQMEQMRFQQQKMQEDMARQAQQRQVQDQYAATLPPEQQAEFRLDPQGYMQRSKPIALGRSLFNPRTGKIEAVDPTLAEERAAKAEDRKQELQTRHEQHLQALAAQNASREQIAEANRQHQIAMARITAGLRQPQPPVAVMGADGKPVYVSAEQAVGRQPVGKDAARLPASALKMQQEDLEAIGLASTISADVGALKKQIEKGELKLGPVSNLASTALNAAGISTENSQNFASFKATLEKMRNDSLRLNKGVQTEGDAVRAWNELFANINDPKVVAKRLGEIEQINSRGASLRKLNVDTIRANFGAEPMDYKPFESQPAAVGKPGGKQVVRRGKYQGKTVVEYSDGTVEFEK